MKTPLLTYFIVCLIVTVFVLFFKIALLEDRVDLIRITGNNNALTFKAAIESMSDERIIITSQNIK